MAYRNPNNRRAAAARAAKLMKLFSPGNFENIMESVDAAPGNQSKPNFDAACMNAGLRQDECDWLWNYLRNVNAALYGPIPEAAASGW